MKPVAVGFVLSVLSIIFGLWIIRSDTGMVDSATTFAPSLWLKLIGRTFAGIMIATSVFIIVMAASSLRVLLEIDQVVPALVAGVIGCSFGVLCWIVVDHWRLAYDDTSIYFPFWRVLWRNVYELTVTERYVLIRGEPGAWNAWSGRVILPKLLWSAERGKWDELGGSR